MRIAAGWRAGLVMTVLWAAAACPATAMPHPELAQVGDVFSFAIFADPQVGALGSTDRVDANARRTQIETIAEVNAMRPMPAFAVFLGDLVNHPDDSSFANFEDCIKHARMTRVLVHGNHDTRPPFDKFLALQRRVNGIDKAWYSFDVGQWHFVIIPSNLDAPDPATRQAEADMLAWLEADLAANRTRPTMVFGHYHLMPQGLTQLEWYTFRLELRLKLLELLTRHGNVKYYFNGHVHNGIKASTKMAWQYQGIRFVTVPTIIEGRNFGEEFAAYAHGLPVGGYYLTVEVNGQDVTLQGRLAGVEQPYPYPESVFREFRDDIEPRWLRRAVEIPARGPLRNGGFENGLNGWQATYRYQADEDPAFQWGVDVPPGAASGQAAWTLNQAKGRTWWARDDMTALYQVATAPAAAHHVLRAAYYLEQRPENGGAFIRFNAISGDDFKFLVLCHLGENQERADYLPRSVGYEIHGKQQSWAFLQQLGDEKQGFYWRLRDDPGQWHELVLDIGALYDRAHGDGAFAALNITKYFVEIGTWCNREPGSRSKAWFDNLALDGASAETASRCDDIPLEVNEWTFRTRFGQDLLEHVTRMARQRHGAER